jgi:hypothetical protein
MIVTPSQRRRIRATLLSACERVKMKRNGEVHCYGKMPNSDKTGWWFRGFDELIVLELADTWWREDQA